MNPEIDIIEIPELLRNKIFKALRFGTDGFTIEKPLSFIPTEHIAADDIVGFRYGVNWVRGYSFVIGRQYFIEVQDQ